MSLIESYLSSKPKQCTLTILSFLLLYIYYIAAGHGSVRGGPDGGQLFGVVRGGVGCGRVAMVGDVGGVQRGGEFGDHHGGDLLRHYWQLGQ